MAVALAIIIHNIPEGIAVSVPVYSATGKKGKALLYSTGYRGGGTRGSSFGHAGACAFLQPHAAFTVFCVRGGHNDIYQF